MQTSNNTTSSSQQQEQQKTLAPPMSLPASLLNKNINLIKPPNLIGGMQQQPPSSDLLASLPPNKLLTQALAKPPSLNLVLNKPVSPSPTHSNASTPSSILTMPKNALLSNGQMSSPLVGSNLIAQTFKSAELSGAPTTQPSLILNNNSSNASSLNSSTADLASSMPASGTAQSFSTLPTPSSLRNDSQTPPAKLSQSLNHIQSNDLFTGQQQQQQQQQPTTAPINQTAMSFFQQAQSQQPPLQMPTSQPSPVNYFQQPSNQQSFSSPPTADSFKNNSVSNRINEQPATAPVNSVPFFQSQPQNAYNPTPPAPPPSQFQSNANLFSQSSQTQMANQPSFQQTSSNYIPNAGEPAKTTNYFSSPQHQQPQPPPPPQIIQSQQIQPKQFSQPTTSYFPTPTPTPPPMTSAPPLPPQQPVQPPPPPYNIQPQQQPPVQNGPFYSNTNSNMTYQAAQNLSQPPPVFNPSVQSTQPPPPSSTSLYSPNNSNNTNNINYPSIRPPPTASELQQQKQFNTPPNYPPTQHQLTNQLSQMSLTNTSNLNQQQLNQPSQPNQPPRQASQYSSSGYSNSNSKSNYFINRSQPQSVDLLREKRLISEFPDADEIARPQFPHEFYTQVNCHHDTIRCTLTAIPESQSLLSKCRLPLGILIHPFKDLESLKVVQSSTIVRCRNCRSYINPFVHFLDNSKWRCNMCYSINDLPDEFLFDPVTRSYGDPSKRPEINSSTIEFIAPAEYTLRPPPPAMYLYLLDVSHNAIATGYLTSFCETLLENIDKIPGDSRTQIGFITYNTSLHFYNLSESLSQPRMMVYPDLEELVLPLPDNLMINLNENRQAIQLFLQALPSMFVDTYETDSALGTALSAAFQLLKHTGGRITIMQTCLPNLGMGSLKTRDESIDKDSTNLGPQTDFYKKMALDCAGVHIAVDLFMFNSLNADLATLSCVSKYSGGEIKYYPGFHAEKHPEQVVRFCVDFKRYLIRKIGFEAVMRIRCTRGLAIHTFHGNFFVRSTDLLALPNVNPDAGFGMQVAIEENLTDITTVCFQAAVLYTSSKGERRIRIHTYCLPVSKNLNELINGADQECIIGLVAKMAVDRTAMSSLKEAKDALMNVAVDYLQAYSQLIVSSQRHSALLSPVSLRLIPTYILALMKNIAFKFGPNVKMDDRVYAMNLHKTMPLKYLMLCIYPHLYAIHNLDDRKVIVDSSETEICIPPRLHLSSENIDRHGVYILDAGEAIYMWIGRSVSDQFLQMVFDCKSFQELPDHSNDLPELDNILSERVRNFLVYLYDSRPFGPTFIYFREDSSKSKLFFQHMHDDKTESSISYYEFLRHLNEQISN